MTATVAKAYVLPPGPEDYVGEVWVTVRLSNYIDSNDAVRGILTPGAVRSIDLEVLVDTGASGLVLPEEVVDVLGLTIIGTTDVVFTDERVDKRPIAEMVVVEVAGRRAVVDCVVGPRDSTPLLGQVVLEVTDLLVDCSGRRLVPDPASPFTTRRSLR